MEACGSAQFGPQDLEVTPGKRGLIQFEGGWFSCLLYILTAITLKSSEIYGNLKMC
jgi:hypothetical protein